MMSIKSIYLRHYCLFLTTFIFALFFTTNLTGQVQVNLRPINPFHFTPEHSWEMDVISMHERSFRIKVLSQIFTKNHQLIAELESDVLMLNKGMNSFNSITTQTQRINYNISEYGDLVGAVGKFPSGDYIICLRFQCLTPDCDGAGSDALFIEPNLCREVSVELPTPLILTTPFDKSEIEETRPMFTWIPPMPIGGIVELRYVYTLTEKREGQSNIDAIRRNRPIIQDQYVERPSLFYPLDIEELEYEKDYVWQVEAWYGNVYIASSEVWEFRLKEDSIIEEISYTQSYIELFNQDGSINYKALGQIKLRFNSRSSNQTIEWKIMDDKEKQIGGTEIIQTIVGDNRVTLDFNSKKLLKHNHHYTLHFKEGKNTFLITIQYFDPEQSDEVDKKIYKKGETKD